MFCILSVVSRRSQTDEPLQRLALAVDEIDDGPRADHGREHRREDAEAQDVTAKPLMGPLPNTNSTMPAISVVMFESAMVAKAWS